MNKRNWLQESLKSWLKTMTKPPFIQARKIQPLGSVRPAGRLPGRPPTVKNPTVGASGRPHGRPKYTEIIALVSGRPLGRPANCQVQACTSVHVGRPHGRPTLAPVDQYGRPLKPEIQKIWDKKFVIQVQVKSHKILRKSTKIVLPIYFDIQTCLHKIKACYKRLNYFCNLKILAQMKNCIFPKLVFQTSS